MKWLADKRCRTRHLITWSTAVGESLEDVYARQAEALSLGDPAALLAWLKARPGRASQSWSRAKIPGVQQRVWTKESTWTNRHEVHFASGPARSPRAYALQAVPVLAGVSPLRSARVSD